MFVPAVLDCTAAPRYRLFFRTGDKLRFRWTEQAPLNADDFDSMENAADAARPLCRMGYPCCIRPANRPAPDTFHPRA